MLLFSAFNANRAYAGTCSAPTQSQLLAMTTDSQVYGALSCLSAVNLYNLLTQPQTNPSAPALTQSQLDSVMGILTSDQIGYLVYPFTEPELNTLLTDFGPAETYNFLYNITANTTSNPPISQAQLVYDVFYPLLNVSGNGNNQKTTPQDLVNLLTSIGQYSNADLYNVLNVIDVQHTGSSDTNYLYDILYPLSNDQLYSVLSLLTPTQFYSLFSTFNSGQILYTLGYLSSSQLYSLLSQLTQAQLFSLLSLLNNKDLYYILTTTLSSTDLYNLFSGSNYSDFQSLISNLNLLQYWSVMASYWLGQNNNNWIYGGNTDSTQTYSQPTGSAPNNPANNLPNGSNNPFPSNGGGGNGGGGGGGGGSASTCNQNSATNVYNCNINITITTQAPNEPSYSQSGGVSVAVANPQ